MILNFFRYQRENWNRGDYLIFYGALIGAPGLGGILYTVVSTLPETPRAIVFYCSVAVFALGFYMMNRGMKSPQTQPDQPDTPDDSKESS